MKTLIAASFFLLVAGSALAHAGHIHTYLGYVTIVYDDGSFMVRTTDGKDLTVMTNAQTIWLLADDHAARRGDLVAGQRVAVRMTEDNRTAASVKMSVPKKKK